MKNTHKGHSATCLCCENLYTDSAERGYSEYTPGCPMSIGCYKKHFNFDEYNISITFEQLHDLGRDCKDFEGKE